MSEKDRNKQQDDSSSDTDKSKQSAVPYIPPPPPDETALKQFRSPLVNGILAAFVILLIGVMAYNYVGHQFTRVAGVSGEKTTTTAPSVSPSISPSEISPSASISPAPSK